MKRALLLSRVGVVLAVLGAVMAPSPAGATAAAAGTLAFAGQASLPKFPCKPPAPGNLPCQGTFVGSIAGELSGVYQSGGQNIPWAIAVATPANIPFAYADGIEPGVLCAEGTAAASATVTADQLQNQVNGVWGGVGTDPLTLPRSVIGASVTFRFTWYRVGVTANLKFDRLTVTLSVFGIPSPITVINVDNTDADPSNDAATGTTGYGLAGFSPAATTDFPTMSAACEGTHAPIALTAEVAGNADMSALLK
jgi:hypothetical protein